MSHARRPLGGAGGSFRRILVGSDGSRAAERALECALSLAGALDGVIQVLLVVAPPAHAETADELALAAQEQRALLAEQLGPIRALVSASVPVNSDVVFSDGPGKALADYAREHAFDIIVVGGHGAEQASHLGAGRSVGALLRDHPCPVLVV